MKSIPTTAVIGYKRWRELVQARLGREIEPNSPDDVTAHWAWRSGVDIERVVAELQGLAQSLEQGEKDWTATLVTILERPLSNAERTKIHNLFIQLADPS